MSLGLDSSRFFFSIIIFVGDFSIPVIVFSVSDFIFIFTFLCVYFLQNKFPGAKSVISRASGSKADVLIEPGDRISFGDLFLEVCQYF